MLDKPRKEPLMRCFKKKRTRPPLKRGRLKEESQSTTGAAR